MLGHLEKDLDIPSFSVYPHHLLIWQGKIRTHKSANHFVPLRQLLGTHELAVLPSPIPTTTEPLILALPRRFRSFR